MSRKPTLADMLEGEFAQGYAEFETLVDFAADLSALSTEDRRGALMFKLLLTATVEALNRAEEKYETPPVDNIATLWRVTGMALALVNAQGFRKEGFAAVRREMRRQILEAYDGTIKSARAAETAAP